MGDVESAPSCGCGCQGATAGAPRVGPRGKRRTGESRRCVCLSCDACWVPQSPRWSRGQSRRGWRRPASEWRVLVRGGGSQVVCRHSAQGEPCTWIVLAAGGARWRLLELERASGAVGVAGRRMMAVCSSPRGAREAPLERATAVMREGDLGLRVCACSRERVQQDATQFHDT
jgi:hypothetical protein